MRPESWITQIEDMWDVRLKFLFRFCQPNSVQVGLDHPYQQCPVAPMELPLGCTPQGNIELMPKKEILKLNSAPRLEQVGDNCPKQMEHRNHRVDDELILPYRANRADGIFGNDSSFGT